MDANGAYDVDSCVTDADAELMLMLMLRWYPNKGDIAQCALMIYATCSS